MRLDLFSELRHTQLARLRGLQRLCATADFTDRDEVYALEAVLRNAAGVLSACAALETLHIHPLLAGKALWAFELARYRHYLDIQFKDLQTRLGALCEHAQRLNPAWKAALTTEGRIFERELGSFLAFFCVYLEHQRGAMRAIAAGCDAAEISAAHWHIASALSLLAETPTQPGAARAPVLTLDWTRPTSGDVRGARWRKPGHSAPFAF